jgi:apolipoprotein N-acyltransferase
VSPLICFEGMFSRPAREACRQGAQVIALLISDAWAMRTFEAVQHSCTASLRAVESRRFVCRVASSGQTAVYSPYGEVIGSIPVWGRGVLSETVHARDGLSTYHRIGDLPFVLLFALFFVRACLRGKQEADA